MIWMELKPVKKQETKTDIEKEIEEALIKQDYKKAYELRNKI